MRPKSGLPKRRALRNMPVFEHGFRANPLTAKYRHHQASGEHATGSYSVTSLFSGCGGMDLGFMGGFRYGGHLYRAHPFHITRAIDFDERAIETYRLNLGEHGVVGDLTAIRAADIPKSRVLIGGFPCQDFSSSGPKVGFAGTRGMLYRVLVDYMNEHQPDVVVGENVPHLKRLNDGKYLQTILREFEACGYDFDVWDMNCPDYGLSQSRRRLFIVGTRRDLSGRPTMPKPTHPHIHRPIEDAIGDLVGVTDETVPNQSQYFVATRATSGGGQGDHTNRRGEVSYCIRANAKARIQFHYELDRRLTVRECARLQSFPDEFVFPFAAMTSMTQIGNAVPPIVGHHVASAVADFLTDLSRGVISTPRAKRHRHEQAVLFNEATTESR